jgi:hypothetical protein
MVVVGGFVLVAIVAFEGLRWIFRPEARRLRVIRKIGGRQ